MKRLFRHMTEQPTPTTRTMRILVLVNIYTRNVIDLMETVYSDVDYIDVNTILDKFILAL